MSSRSVNSNLEEDDKTTSVLSELGLNEYEMRAYLTILEGGTVVAREISDRSSIPYAKVYQVLESLVGKQLIFGDEGRPRKFRGRDPKIALKDRLNFLKNEWEKLHKKRTQLVENYLLVFSNLFDSSHDSMINEEGVWQIHGLTNIQSRLSKLFQSISESIRISTSDSDFVETKLSKLLDSINSDVEITIRTKTPSDNLSKYGRVLVDSKIGDATELILDDFAQIIIIESNRGKYTQGEYKAVLTQINQIVEAAIINFNTIVGDF